MGKKKSIGLPGGPNEFLQDITQYISIEGYKSYSPDKNNPVNIIESGSITMEDVDFPVLGTDNLGNSQMMFPENDYQFPGNSVYEVPLQNFPRHFQDGGSLPKFQIKGEVQLPEVTVKGTDPFKYKGMTGGVGGDGYTNTDYVNDISYVNEVLPTEDQFNRTKSYILKDRLETDNFNDSLYMALLSQNYSNVLQPNFYGTGPNTIPAHQDKNIEPADYDYTSLSLDRLLSDSDWNSNTRDHPDYVYDDVPENIVELMRNYSTIGYSKIPRKILNRADLEKDIEESKEQALEEGWTTGGYSDLDPNKRYSVADGPGGDKYIYVPYHSFPKGKRIQPPAPVTPKRKKEKLINIPPRPMELIPIPEMEGPKKVAPFELTKNNSSHFTVQRQGIGSGTYPKGEDGEVLMQLKDQAGRVVWEGSQTEYEKNYGDFLEKGDTEYGKRKKNRLYLKKQYGGSLPKAQFGWNDFEKSKAGKFVDAKGLRRDGENLMATVGDYFGYEANEGKDLALDATAIVNPLADFLHAGTKFNEEKYTDAALYAGFGILPFGAGPLVRGTKKHIINPIKNLFKSAPTPRGTTLNKYGQIKTTFDDQLDVVNKSGYNEVVRQGKIPSRNGYFDINVRGDQSIPNNSWNVQISSPAGPDNGFMQLVKSDKGVYHLDMSMPNRMDAGQSIQYLSEYVPKGAIIQTAPNGSLSLDSYKLLTNQIKRGKFLHIPSDRTVQLNMMSKDMAKIDMNNAGMVTKTEADRIVKDVNKMLDNAGIEQRATATKVVEDAYEMSNVLTWKVNIPELPIEVNFKDGGSLPKVQTGNLSNLIKFMNEVAMEDGSMPTELAQAGLEISQKGKSIDDQEYRKWLKDWLNARKKTGRFEDQLSNEDLAKYKKNINNVQQITRDQQEQMFPGTVDNSGYLSWLNAPTGGYTMDLDELGNDNPKQHHYFGEPTYLQMFTNMFDGLDSEGSTKIHELTHAMTRGEGSGPFRKMYPDKNWKDYKDLPIQNAIKNIPIGFDEWYDDPTIFDSYDGDPEEILAQLMEYRYNFNVDPNKIFTEDDIKEVMKNVDKQGDAGLFGLDIFEPKEIIRLLNEVASVEDIIPKGTVRAKDGIELPIAQADATNVYQQNPNILIAQEETVMPGPGIIYDPTSASRNPNLQWMMGAQPGVTPGTSYADNVAIGYNELIGATIPIPILEGLQLTSKGARIPGLIDDGIIKPIVKGYKWMKSAVSSGSKSSSSGTKAANELDLEAMADRLDEMNDALSESLKNAGSKAEKDVAGEMWAEINLDEIIAMRKLTDEMPKSKVSSEIRKKLKDINIKDGGSQIEKTDLGVYIDPKTGEIEQFHSLSKGKVTAEDLEANLPWEIDWSGNINLDEYAMLLKKIKSQQVPYKKVRGMYDLGRSNTNDKTISYGPWKNQKGGEPAIQDNTFIATVPEVIIDQVSENNKKENQELGLSNILSYMVDTRGGTENLWTDLADNIAYHESGYEQRMDPKAIQRSNEYVDGKKTGNIVPGPGRGMFQFESKELNGSGSFATAQKRYKNVAEAAKKYYIDKGLDGSGFELNENILNAKEATELSKQDQYTLFFANLIESKAVLKDYADGKLLAEDVWLQGHKNVSADGNKESFRSSVKKAKELEPEGIKKGFSEFTLEDLLLYKSGGEYNIFQDYVTGNYDNTDNEKQAEKIYDKLNRIHYKEAKEVGMSPANYIMTNLMGHS